MIYATTYSVDGVKHSAEIEADDLTHARMLAVQRGLNEAVENVKEPSQSKLGLLRRFILERQWPEALHEATFLCFIGTSSGVLTAREVLHDGGLLHELAHLQVPAELNWTPELTEATIAKCLAQAKDYETRVPGWPRNAIEARTRGTAYELILAGAKVVDLDDPFLAPRFPVHMAQQVPQAVGAHA